VKEVGGSKGIGAGLQWRHDTRLLAEKRIPEAFDGLPVCGEEPVLFFLFMTVLSQSFFTLMRSDLMTLSFFTTRHIRLTV
jgi:hypothetical protein